MKLSNKNLTISLKEIDSIVKESMAVPINPEAKEEMREEGWFIGHPEDEKPLPHVTRTKAKDIMTQYFPNLTESEAIQLPKIYKVNDDNIVDIEGKDYYLIHVIEPKKKAPKGSTEIPDGKIICIQPETGDQVHFSYNKYIDKIKSSPRAKEKTLLELNKTIEEYNQKISELNKALGFDKTALQLVWVESKIKERLETLDKQHAAIEQRKNDPMSASKGYASWINFLREGIKNHSIPLKDLVDTLLFLHQAEPQKLIDMIRNNEIALPEEYKNTILGIASQEAVGIEESKNKIKDETQEREERIEEPLPEEKDIEPQPLKPLTLEDIPQSKYKKSTAYYTIEKWIKSHTAQMITIDRDRKELSELLSTFESARKFLGTLEKGQRSANYLSTPEGQNIVRDIEGFLDKAQIFLKRYKDPISDESGNLNTKLLGRGGTLGNALVGVTLQRIYSVIKGNLNKVKELQKTQIPQEKAQETPQFTETTNFDDIFAQTLKNLLKKARKG